MEDTEALRAMSQWLASLPLELVRRRGAHARLQESVDALLQPPCRTCRDKIRGMLVAWGQAARAAGNADEARRYLFATVLRVGGELQRARNRDRPALKAARAWMRELPESALADSPALKRLRTSLFNVEETLQDIHALAAHGVVCTQPDGRKRPAWHIEADLCDSLEAAVLHQKKLRGAEQPAQAQEDGVLGQEATAAGPCSGQEDPLVRVQRLHGMELLNAESWLQARTPADPDAESLQRDVRQVLTYLACPGTEGPLHLWAVTAGRNVEETAQMLLRAVSLRQRRWRALQSPLTPALRQDDREMPAFSAGFRLTDRRWALGQAALRVFLLERGVAMEEVAMKACMGLVDNLRKGTAIQQQRRVEGKLLRRAPAFFPRPSFAAEIQFCFGGCPRDPCTLSLPPPPWPPRAPKGRREVPPGQAPTVYPSGESPLRRQASRHRPDAAPASAEIARRATDADAGIWLAAISAPSPPRRGQPSPPQDARGLLCPDFLGMSGLGARPAVGSLPRGQRASALRAKNLH